MNDLPIILWALSGIVIILVTQCLMLRWDKWDISYLAILLIAPVGGPFLGLVLWSELRDRPIHSKKAVGK